MLLALDVGNSNLVAGVYEGETLRGHWRLRTERERTADEYGLQLRGLLAAAGLPVEAIEAVAIASVVPRLAPTLAELSRRTFGRPPLVVGENLYPRLPVRYEPPSDVGPDRLVDAVAALRRYGTPVLVVDLGTATTFNAVSREGEYLGGAIAPGIGTSLEALFQGAARLHWFSLERPENVIGRNTVAAMRSGSFHGFVAMVEGMIDRFKVELGPETRVVATGGWSELIGGAARGVDYVEPQLTLEGLRLVWEERSSLP
jgi:type III pantothenate kinase